MTVIPDGFSAPMILNRASFQSFLINASSDSGKNMLPIVRGRRIHWFVLNSVLKFWLVGCRHQEDEAGIFQKKEQFLHAHDFKKGDPKVGSTLAPFLIEFPKPTPGTRIHRTESIDLVVRLRLVRGSRVPTLLTGIFVHLTTNSVTPIKIQEI